MSINNYNKFLSQSQHSLRTFIEAFGYADDATIYLQTLRPNGCQDGYPQILDCNVGDLLNPDSDIRHKIRSINESMGIYFCPNHGGRSDSEIHTFTAFFVDFDEGSKNEQLDLLDGSAIEPSIVVETKRGHHAYWLIDGRASNAQWVDVQERLIAHFGSDASIINPGRCMRLPFFNYVMFADGEYSYAEVPVIKFNSTLRYSVSEMVEEFGPVVETDSTSLYSENEIYGGRYKNLKGFIVKNGRKRGNGIYETTGICHDGEGDTALCFNSNNGSIWCFKCTLGDGKHLDEVCAAIGLEVCDISDFCTSTNTTDEPSDVRLPVIQSLRELVEKDLPPINWTIDGMISEGAILFFSPPKMGKSLAVLDLAIEVGRGGNWLGNFPVSKGKALYLDLENGETILQKRVKSRPFDSAHLEDVDYATEWPRLNESGLEELEKWIVSNPEARLIVIDTLERIRPLSSNRNPYREDYAAVSKLNDLAHKYHVSIVIVHHTNQQSEVADFYTACSGTNGLTGGVDGAMRLNRERHSTDAVLEFGGRVVEEQKIQLEFDTTRLQWKSDGREKLSELAERFEKELREKDCTRAEFNQLNNNRTYGVDEAIRELRQSGRIISSYAKPNGRRVEIFRHASSDGNDEVSHSREASFLNIAISQTADGITPSAVLAST